jgi:ABC-type amino acid transport system permease subunit
VAAASWLYTWFFRGTPVLVQHIFWYNLQLLIGNISLGIPFGPVFATSLVSIIAVTDLLKATEDISSVNYQVIPLLMVASIWYLILTSALSAGQYYVERYYNRGSGTPPAAPLQLLRRNFTTFHVRPAVPRRPEGGA